jgi:YVTN family beta-propeller protein
MDVGCGNTYRPITTPLPVTSGNPSGAETAVVLNQILQLPNQAPVGNSVLTSIDVSGDTNMGSKPLNNVVASAVTPVTTSTGSTVNIPASPMAFDFNRTAVFTANKLTDTVTQQLINSATTGFAANTTTLSLDPGSAPIGMSFQYFGSTYTQTYVVNSGTGISVPGKTTCSGTGSITAITQAGTATTPTAAVKATVCVGPKPVFAWIYKDQTKVFVLDQSEGTVYVVNASSYKVTNKIAVGTGPIMATQSGTGQFIYVLNSGDNTITPPTPSTISIIDGQAETVVGTVHPTTDNANCGALCNSPVIDLGQNNSFNDTIANSQANRLWMLHANGTVSVYDGTTPGALTWITSLSTISATQAAAGAFPTNLALMRDGSQAYVGLGGTSQIVAIDTSKLATGGVVTNNATTAITLDVIAGGISHRGVSLALPDQAGNLHTVPVEQTAPIVNFVAVSRQGNSSDLSKVYATTTTNTTYLCYAKGATDVSLTPCTNADPWSGTSSFLTNAAGAAVCTSGTDPNTMSCPGLFNGTAVVTAASNGTTPINTFVTTILSPWVGTFAGPVVNYCNAGNLETGDYDGQKNCPTSTPVFVLGRN